MRFKHEEETLKLLELLKFLYELDPVTRGSVCLRVKFDNDLHEKLIQWVINNLGRAYLRNEE